MSSSCFGGRRNKDTSDSPVSLRSPRSITNGHISNGYSSVVNKHMCYYCFDVLLNHLGMGPYPHNPPITNKSYPLFVTWTTGKDKRLRGCIGTFNEQPLIHGLKEYAISSAFKDNRFDAIGKHEVHRLHCSVSLLTNFESHYRYNEWIVGKHGIRIEFTDERGSSRSATYLPEVASEQGWDHRATIDSLMRKAGYKGVITEELRLSIKLTRYQSEKCAVSYEEYISLVSVPNNNINNHNAQW